MKLLLPFLAALLLVACQCGSPQKSGPPWENFSEPERSEYVGKYACPEATAFVRLVNSSEWLVISPEEPVLEQPGFFVEVLASPEGQIVAKLYRKDKNETIVDTMLVVSPSSNLIVDYEVFVRVVPVLRRLQNGEISEEDADIILSAAYGSSQGKYFCYLFRNNKPLH